MVGFMRVEKTGWQGAELRRRCPLPFTKDSNVDQKPSIGRVVHYQTFGTADGSIPSEVTAAIITKVHTVHDGMVDLCVLYSNGMSFKQGIPFSLEPLNGAWNWPPRV